MSNKKPSSAAPARRAYAFKDKMTPAEKIFFGLACALSAFLTTIIQTCFFFNFRPFGFAPDLCLALSAVSGLKFGPKCGGIVGLLAGFFVDAFSSQGFSLAIPFYLLLGVMMGLLSADGSGVSLPHFPLFLVGMAVGTVISALSSVFNICMTYSSFNIADIAFRTVVPEALCTLIFSVTVYPPAALVSRILKKNQGFAPK